MLVEAVEAALALLVPAQNRQFANTVIPPGNLSVSLVYLHRLAKVESGRA